MEDEEDKKSGQGFIKEQTGKLKEKGKEEAKKQIMKKVIIPFVVAHSTIFIALGISMIALLAVIIIAGSLKLINNNKAVNVSNAKNRAISYVLGSGTGEDESTDASTIKILYDNGVYSISNNYSKKDINNIKDEISVKGKNISNFTDFEIGIIGALMENGLNINNYTTEELKCFPLFIRTEACSRYLDLRPNSEKFDSNGDYKPQKLKDLKENEIPGIILVKRTNTSTDNSVPLEYINLSSFNDMVSQNNYNVINYFTIDENNNLVVAKWKYERVEVDGEYPSGIERTSEKEEYTIEEEKIPYSEYIKKYTMPFDFLMQLLTTTGEAEFCKELTNVIVDSQIVINIQEEETRTVNQDVQKYDIYNKKEKTINYAMIGTKDGNNEVIMKKEPKTVETHRETTVTVTTTNISHSYIFEIKEVDTWLAHYIKEYKESTQEIVSANPQTTEILGEYGDPSSSSETPDENEEEIEEFKSNKEKEFSDSGYDSPNCRITTIETESYRKIDKTSTITEITERYISDKNPTTDTYIYAKDENGNFEKFLLIYNKYAYSRAMMNSIDSWLYDMMKSNENTIDLIDYIKYLLYVYDGIDRGVTEIDTSIFEPSEFKSVTNSKGIIVKTDEPLAIKELTKEEIEEVINKNFSGQRRENLLSAIDGLMYIQNTYNVNAVFAIAVTEAESGCGTNWRAIDPETYNWCSFKGDYNGNYYTDSSGTSWRKYSSFDEATRDFGDWIANSSYYFKAGKYTLYNIGPTYCDAAWGEEVAKYIKEMYETIGISMYATGGNDLQQRVVEVASNSSGYGITAEKGYCQAWVANVYYRAGANNRFSYTCCAVHAGSQWGVSTDFSQIQVGATVYGYVNKSEIPNYGHVGIYIGDGMVAHNIGGVKVDDLDDWIKRYNGVCWGWNGGTDLTGGSYSCKKGLMTPNH